MDWPQRNWLDSSVENEVLKVLHYYQERQQDLPAQGFFEEKYCASFSEYQGGGYTDAVNSGTSAVYIALRALGLSPGDTILSSPVTDFGTISAVILNQLNILVADSMIDNFNLSLKEIKSIHQKTNHSLKALLLTHSAGDPIKDIEEIALFCKEQGLYLIEDCSQSHGAEAVDSVGVKKKVGTFGDIAVFSTMHSKNHSTGSTGGLVFTKDLNLFHKIRSHSDRGKRFHESDFNSKDPQHIDFSALNLNSNEISCAIGSLTLAKLPEVIIKRRKYLSLLQTELMQADLPLEIAMDLESSSPYFCPVLIKDKSLPIAKIKKALRESHLPVNTSYDFLVSTWEWAKSSILNFNETPHVVNFKEESFNLLFNENYGPVQAEQTIELLRKRICYGD
ncbi:MAG: hypothetical protein CME63_10615 [Halobacteriovoraceae bacterium]|nr:hypothetical protein [Halobacteriovoraceae bacterium]|tara:strand:- start:88212 stop:89387 length:1176 start_codon:yes stop_codon:yes gene_type:complete